MVNPLNQGVLRNLVVLSMAALGLILPTNVAGQILTEEFEETVTSDLDWLEEEDPYQPNVGLVSFGAGIDFTNAYFFRGALQEDQGFIAQPWAEMTFDLYDGSGTVNDVTLSLGIWNSIQDNVTGTRRQQGLQEWYESDLYFTLSFGIAENWGLGLSYIAYTSPNDAFATIHEVMIAITYDDSLFWKGAGVNAPGFNGLQPSLTFAVEIESTAFGTDEGSILEIGIEPGFTTFAEIGGEAVNLSFPMTLGISLDNYYNDGTGDDTFGYFNAGMVATWPISFIAPDYGAWELAAGVNFLFLSSNLEAANNGDDFEIIGTLGVSMGY